MGGFKDILVYVQQKRLVVYGQDVEGAVSQFKNGPLYSI
jgi:hypothetical protein